MAFTRFTTAVTAHPLALSLVALGLGQLLFLLGLGGLYIGALVVALAIILPYPALFRSWLSRLVGAFLIAFSLVQAAAAVQFFILPTTGFGILSLMVTSFVLALAWSFRRKVTWPTVVFDRHDVAGFVAAAFFALPFAVLCFWQNDPARIATFASVQGVDGGNHYRMMAEVSQAQHLTYRTSEYYPKGFHLASAFMLHGLQANQSQQDWAANARVYAGMYIAWAVVLASLLMYLATQLIQALVRKARPSPFSMALAIGPVLAAFHSSIFAQEGFVSYYYVIAALVLGVLYVSEQATRQRRWPLGAYLLLAFGVAMSWGPLLTPVLLAIPLLFLAPRYQGIASFVRAAVSTRWRLVTAAFLLQAVPLYLHAAYAQLNAEQGLNATGGIKDFNYGIVLIGLVVAGYCLWTKGVPAAWRAYAGNVLLPLFVLVGGLACFQYFTVGELRYYAIKMSYTLEIMIVIMAAALLAGLVWQRSQSAWHRWVAYPALFGLGAILIIGMTTNPFAQARILFRDITKLSVVRSEARHYAELGVSGHLDTNVMHVRYLEGSDHLIGSAVLNNWARLMQYTADDGPKDGLCNGRIFAVQTNPTSSTEHDNELIAAARDCRDAAAARHKSFIIVTDKASVNRLRATLGDRSIRYVYQ